MRDEATIPLTWPDNGLRPHPFAGIFRLLAGEEKESLASSVVEKGLQEKVKIYEGQILDGRNRYLVMVDEGVFDPEIETWQDRPELFEQFEGTRDEALDYVWALNAERRHDTPAQRALAAEKYANLRNVTQAEAAAKFGVSERQVNSASKVLEQGEPELVQAVEEGRLPLYIAEQVADLDEDDQREVAELPKREASAKAKEKLKPLPTLGEAMGLPPVPPAAPVVKPLDPTRFVLFARSVLNVADRIGHVPGDTVHQLAAAWRLSSERDGQPLSREALLGIETAERKSEAWGYDSLNRQVHLIEAAAGMPEDIDALIGIYKETLVAYDRAVMAEDEALAAMLNTRLEAILFRSNGDATMGRDVNARPNSIRDAATAPDGEVPLWGQTGKFMVEVDGVKALVHAGRRSIKVCAVEFGVPFPAAHGSMEVTYLKRSTGTTMLKHGEAALRWAMERAEEKKDRKAHEIGRSYPSRVHRFGAEDKYGDAGQIECGIELDEDHWPDEIGVTLAVADAQQAKWRAEESAWPRPRKRAFPQSRHSSISIFAIGTDGTLVPAEDFPTSGRYLAKHWSGWRYVDDATDPGEEAVSARMIAGGAVPDRSAYEAALASLTEPKGKLHQSTARDALAAGLAAGVPVRQMASDLGHPLGTVQSWTARLGLTSSVRNPVKGAEGQAL